jgi:hypothetical protein
MRGRPGAAAGRGRLAAQAGFGQPELPLDRAGMGQQAVAGSVRRTLRRSRTNSGAPTSRSSSAIPTDRLRHVDAARGGGESAGFHDRQELAQMGAFHHRFYLSNFARCFNFTDDIIDGIKGRGRRCAGLVGRGSSRRLLMAAGCAVSGVSGQALGGCRARDA